MTDQPTPSVRLPRWSDINFIGPLAQHLGVAEIATNAEGNVVRWNDAAERLYGYTAAEAIGAPIMSLTVGPEDTSIAESIMEKLGAGTVWEGTFDCRHRDGHTITVHVVDLPVVDDENQVVGVVGLSAAWIDDYTVVNRVLAEVGELTELHQGTVRTIEQERERIARELHDGVGQYLTALRGEIALLRRSGADGIGDTLDRMEATLDSGLRSLRGVIDELRPRVLDELGICEALAALVQDFGERTGFDASVQIDEDRLGWITHDVENTVYRIAQECLSNIERHGEGTQVVSVHLTTPSDGPDLVLRVRNDGRDYDGQRGFGVRSMLLRARSHGGTMAVETHPDGGVLAELRIPAERAFTGEVFPRSLR